MCVCVLGQALTFSLHRASRSARGERWGGPSGLSWACPSTAAGTCQSLSQLPADVSSPPSSFSAFGQALVCPTGVAGLGNCDVTEVQLFAFQQKPRERAFPIEGSESGEITTVPCEQGFSRDL